MPSTDPSPPPQTPEGLHSSWARLGERVAQLRRTLPPLDEPACPSPSPWLHELLAQPTPHPAPVRPWLGDSGHALATAQLARAQLLAGAGEGLLAAGGREVRPA